MYDQRDGLHGNRGEEGRLRREYVIPLSEGSGMKWNGDPRELYDNPPSSGKQHE